MKIATAEGSQQAATMPEANARLLRQSSLSPQDACTVFGQGIMNVIWDDEKSQVREFPDGDCGLESTLVFFNQSVASQSLLKKVCSFTGTSTNSTCGENSFLGYLNKFVSPIMGLVTDQCR